MQAIVIFDIDGVLRDVAGSYRRALADTVEHFTGGAYRPSSEDIDALKAEGTWNNDWEGSQEFVYRYFEEQGENREEITLDYSALVAFFQSRYRGVNPHKWDGYITSEPLLVNSGYFEELTANELAWGFFSGATRLSAEYVLKERLGLENPLLIAMEDAPGKPDPTGLFGVIDQLKVFEDVPVIYVGDTVADMYTIKKAKEQKPERPWFAVGILPPHVQGEPNRKADYEETLRKAGAMMVLDNVEELTPPIIKGLVGL